MVDKQQLAAMGEHMREVEECKPGFKVPDEQVLKNPPSIEQLTTDYRNAKDYAFAIPVPQFAGGVGVAIVAGLARHIRPTTSVESLWKGSFSRV